MFIEILFKMLLSKGVYSFTLSTIYIYIYIDTPLCCKRLSCGYQKKFLLLKGAQTDFKFKGVISYFLLG